MAESTLRKGREGVRRWRSRRGWTQAQLAQALGVDGSTVRHFESGRRSLPLETRVKLHVVADVPIQHLLTRGELRAVMIAAEGLAR